MKTPGEIIRAETAGHRAITFARFMALALYAPGTGYYEKNPGRVGPRGDFITSVSTGKLFGELLAFQFAAWLEESAPAGSGHRIIEAGAHAGTLAADILAWLQKHRPGLFSKIEYHLLEPSAARRQWQEQTLEPFAPRVRWAADFASLENLARADRRTSIIFSNELLDAFPVHRHGWDAKSQTWFEWGVTVAGEKFVWAKIPNSAFSLPHPQLAAVLPDGYTVETAPAATNWWRAAAGILRAGKLVAIDYGFTAAEQFSPARTSGTARAYRQHRASADLLADPGEQDLTAHVNFSALQETGEAAGLQTEIFCTQPQFLTRILQKAVGEKSFAAWDARRARQWQTLTHPEHLGRAFRVLVQSRQQP